MITIYYAACAIALFAALQAVPLSSANRQRHVYRAYLFLCGFTALFLGSTAALLGAPTLAEFAQYSRWQGVGAFGFMTSFVWLMANYAHVQFRPKIMAGLIFFTLVTAALTVYSLTLPFGLFVDNVTLLGHIDILGSKIVQIQYDYRPSSVVYQLLGFASVLWGAWCCRLLWRNSNRFAAILLSSYLVVLGLSFALQLLYNFGHVQADIPGGITFLWLFVVISLCFGHDTRLLVQELNQQRDELHEEVERRRIAEHTVRAQAFSDSLTGLPNELELRAQLKETLLSDPTGLSLMLVQVERLREIRQSLSESYCDAILVSIADRLKADMPNSQLIARIKDDTFAVLSRFTQGYALDRASGAGGWLPEHELSKPFTAGRQKISICFNAGIIDLTIEDSAQTALYKADLALDEAANVGAGAIRFYSAALARQHAELSLLETDLKTAIEFNELRVCFQPLFNREYAPDGAEALLRWYHPDLGDISPSVFIPLAERSGLASALGDWVLDQVCANLHQWLEQELPIHGRVSVNVSPWQLQSENFADKVLNTLARHNLPPERLTLEITESTLVDNLTTASQKLSQLRQQGIHIALDDFGTGFSSLAYLSQLPLDALKIDKSFVNDLDRTRNHELISSMINIGKALNLSVVVEGVETQAQLNTLAALGCDRYQGYLFSAPLAGLEYRKWLTTHGRKLTLSAGS